MTDRAFAALEAVEQWWLTQADQSVGAPACIFMVREVLAAHKRTALDTTRDAARQLRKSLGLSQDFDDWPVEKLMQKAAERIGAEVKHVRHN